MEKDNFKIPTKSLNHVGNLYKINSFFMFSYRTTQTKNKETNKSILITASMVEEYIIIVKKRLIDSQYKCMMIKKTEIVQDKTLKLYEALKQN